MKKMFLMAAMVTVAIGTCYAADIKLPKKENVVIKTIDTKGAVFDDEDVEDLESEDLKSEDTADKKKSGDKKSEDKKADTKKTDGKKVSPKDVTGDKKLPVIPSEVSKGYGKQEGTFDINQPFMYRDWAHWRFFEAADDLNDAYYKVGPNEYPDRMYDPRTARISPSFAHYFSEEDLDYRELRMIQLINNFRFSSDAYYTSKTGKGKINKVNKLDGLELDFELWMLSRWRAHELTKKYSYYRPNNEGYCSAFEVMELDYEACGEVISANCDDPDYVFEWLKGDANDPYDQQFDRRQLLGDYNRIGVFLLERPGTEYTYYWVITLMKMAE